MGREQGNRSTIRALVAVIVLIAVARASPPLLIVAAVLFLIIRGVRASQKRTNAEDTVRPLPTEQLRQYSRAEPAPSREVLIRQAGQNRRPAESDSEYISFTGVFERKYYAALERGHEIYPWEIAPEKGPWEK